MHIQFQTIIMLVKTKNIRDWMIKICTFFWNISYYNWTLQLRSIFYQSHLVPQSNTYHTLSHLYLITMHWQLKSQLLWHFNNRTTNEFNVELLLWKNLKCHFHDSLRHTINHILHCRESYQRNYESTFSQPLERVPRICFGGLISWNWEFKNIFHPPCFQ